MTPANETIRWGIIGTGGIARAFARDIARAEGHQVYAVGSRSSSTAESFASEFPCIAFSSYEELVGSDLDAVYVATPHPMHAPHTILALDNGKPVLCEKPFAVNAGESAAMIAKAREKNLLLVEAMWSRFLPHYRKIRELVESGELGEIRLIQADHGQALPADPYYRLHAPELAGGALLDLGIYPISLTHMLLGVPDRIQSTSSYTSSGVDAQTSMILDYKNGAQALLTTTLEVQTPCTARIVGTKATLEVHSTFYRPTSMTLTKLDGSRIDFANDYLGHGLREQAIEFGKLLRAGKKESEIISLADSHQIMEIMDEIRRANSITYPFEK